MHTSGWRFCAGAAAWAGWLCFGLLLTAQTEAHAGGAQARDISSIQLQRDCSGCPTGTLLVLQRDGTAVLSTTGKSRLGTQNTVARGAVRPEDFHALAHLAVTQGFFRLEDSYQQPDVMDGSWSTVVITRAGQDKTVFSRELAGPEGLRAIEAAIDAVQAGIHFSPFR